mmetsp:Transcript_29061/g.61851  ORF Transcript_29061/g.61851 Transcript_29061/m.61851 type:complete len:112 (-) Transcript_29061:290-625(-)
MTTCTTPTTARLQQRSSNNINDSYTTTLVTRKQYQRQKNNSTAIMPTSSHMAMETSKVTTHSKLDIGWHAAKETTMARLYLAAFVWPYQKHSGPTIQQCNNATSNRCGQFF